MARKINRPVIGSGQLDVNDQTHAHEQVVPDTTWTINHNLNKFPNLIVKDATNVQVIPTIDFALSTNATLVINFLSPETGVAYLN